MSSPRELIRSLNQNPIVVNPTYIDITGSHTAGILLSQIMYWWSAVGGRKFYKTDLELMRETRMSEKKLRTAKNKIKALSFVKVTVEGLPAKTFYDIDSADMMYWLSAESSHGNEDILGQSSYSEKGGTLTPEKGGTLTPGNGGAITETTTETTQNNMSSKKPLDESAKNLIHYLNEKSGRNYKAVASNLKLISARIKEGHSVKEIKSVIDEKCAQWRNDPKMCEYLRPATLFGAEKFNQYVGQIGTVKPNSGKSEYRKALEQNMLGGI